MFIIKFLSIVFTSDGVFRSAAISVCNGKSVRNAMAGGDGMGTRSHLLCVACDINSYRNTAAILYALQFLLHL